MKAIKKIQYNSPVILTFSFVSLAALLLGFLTKGWTTQRLFCVYRAPLSDPLTYLRMFLHVLGHSGYEHYMGNILLMLVIGPGLEERYGSRAMVFVILATALVSGLVQFAFFPGSALLGASGIVYMLIILASLSGIKQGSIPLTLLLVTVFYLGGEVAKGIFVKDNISQLTHVIGGIVGGVFGFYVNKNRKNIST